MNWKNLRSGSFCIDCFGDFFYVQKTEKAAEHLPTIYKGSRVRFQAFDRWANRDIIIVRYDHNTVLWQDVIVQEN